MLLGSTETPWLPDARVVLPGTKSGDIRRSVLYGAHRLWVPQSSATLLAEAPPTPATTPSMGCGASHCSLSHVSVLHGGNLNASEEKSPGQAHLSLRVIGKEALGVCGPSHLPPGGWPTLDLPWSSVTCQQGWQQLPRRDIVRPKYQHVCPGAWPGPSTSCVHRGATSKPNL